MSSTSGGGLLPAESRLLGCVSRGDPLVIEPDADDNEIRAAVLRSIVLSLPLPEHATGTPILTPPFRVSVRGARISGAFRLDDARPAEGAPAPCVVLEDCVFPEPIGLAHSRIARLSLAGSRLTHLDAPGLVVDGPLDLSRVTSIGSHRGEDGIETPGECRVDLRGARIAGGLKAAGAQFRAPPPVPDFDPWRQRSTYALDLREAVIGGSVSLTEGVVLHGGISLVGARIAGDVWLVDARVRAGEMHAINAQTLELGGAFVICSSGTSSAPAAGAGEGDREGEGRDGCSVEGGAWFLGARIAGVLDIRGVHMSAGSPTSWGGASALVLSGARVGGDVQLTCTAGSETRASEPTVVDGGIHANNLTVEGTLALSGSRLSAGRGAAALILDGASIGGDLRLDAFVGWRHGRSHAYRFKAEGELTMDGLRVKRGLYLAGADLRGSELSRGVAVKDARIGGRVACQPSTSVPISFEDSLVEGDFDFDSGASGDRLEFIQRGNLVGVSLAGTVVKGTLSARRLTVLGIPESESHPRSFPAIARAIEDDKVRAVRLARLPFYPGWSLCEILVPTTGGLAVASLLWNHAQDAALVLDGNSAPIHSVNQTGILDLRDEKLAAAYLAFFCAHVWGPEGEGAFHILSEPGSIPGEGGATIDVPGIEVNRDGKDFGVAAAVHFAGRVFRTSFTVAASGHVQMVGDTPIAILAPTVAYDPPFRRATSVTAPAALWPLPPALPSWEWRESSLEEWQSLLRAGLGRHALRSSRAAAPRLTVDLRGLAAGTLRDNHGAGWGQDVYLELAGISIERVAGSAQDEERKQRRETDQKFRRLTGSIGRNRGHLVLLTATALVMGPVVLVLSLLLVPLAAAYAGALWVAASCAAVTGNVLNRASRTRPPLSAGSVVARWTQRPYPFPSTAAWRVRRLWLASQYMSYRATKLEYTPEPYAQLAQAYHKQGRFDDARRLTSLRLTTERRVRTALVWRPFLWLYWLLFDYGLSPRRAIATVVFFILLGWAGAHYANTNDLLVLETTASATVAVEQETGAGGVRTLVPGALIAPDSAARLALPCADAISPFLYALDVFIPLLDLRQEFRCHVGRVNVAAHVSGAESRSSARSWRDALVGHARRLLDSPEAWLVLKAAYGVIGWLVISLAVLTISGVLRRQAEA